MNKENVKKEKKTKTFFKEALNKATSEKNSILIFFIGYTLLISTFVAVYSYKNSEKIITKLFDYLAELNNILVLMLLISVLTISLGKYVLRRNGRNLLLNKFIKHPIYIDKFIFSTTLIFIMIFSTFELSIKFNAILLLKLFVWVMGKQITPLLVSMILIIYIYCIVLELFETFSMVLLKVVNKIFEEIKSPLDRYTLLITFIGTVISLIALAK